ncbi:MAG: chitobiase/beta-hexosaminidase C-terminal domain-containing protein, partial [Chitinivibrionales bacterium]
MRQLLQKFWCLIILFIIGIYAQTPNPGTHIIHIYHPWANNPDYNTFGLKIQRWDDAYPGADMTHEAGYWYSYEYETTEAWQTEEIFEIALFYTQNDNVVYSPGLSIDALFTGHTEEDEVWLIPKDSTSMPEIHFSPPEAKVIQFLNPWPNSVPRSILEGEGESERMRINESYCGWFTQFYVGKDIQNLKYKFVNVLDESDIYTASGLNSGGFIDLSTMLSNNDTVWIQPSPHPYGPPVLSANFPNMLAECPYRDLSALVRDQNASNIAFELSDNSNERITGMVQDTLTLDGDIIRGNGELNSQTIEDWFDATESPYDTCINITVEKTDDGMWLYDSDWDGGFFPIDDFNNPNNQAGYQDADGNDRNFHFTMEMWMSFEYHEGSDQTFIFRGDDDVWVFIDRQLTFDIGGIHQPLADTVNLDEAKDQLGLVDGETYSMAIFFCERKTSGSNFLMKTSIDLQSSSNLKYKTSEPSTDAVKYDIYEIVTSQQLDCGENTFSGEEQPVISKFTLTGPQFSEPYELGKGTDYGGITVSEDSTSVTVDTSSIKGLLPGNYTITFTHSRDQTKYGSIVFTVTSELTDMPSPDPVPGEYSSEVSVDYTCATPEARIYYTFDAMEDFPHDEEVSSTSWSLLSEPITLTSSDTIYAVAIADGKAPSYKAMSPYTIIIPQAATPVSDPPSGVYTEFPEVSLTTETPEADIYYTLENGVPFSVDDWEVYSSVQPVYISNSDTLRAVAVAEGYTNSDIMTAIYTIELPPAATPVADPPGGEYQSMLIDTITLSSETENSRIYYTFDGSIPFSPSAWNLFSESSPLSAEIDRTLYAIAVADGHTRSEMLVAQYTLNLPRAETPEITPPGGVYYQTIDDITIQSEYDDARLYYSYSDTARFNPNSDEWTEYSPGSSISFSSTGTIRAVATKYGYNPSLPARETYTIRFPRGISGSYIDTKGDGTINRAIITLDTVVSPDLPEMAYLNS